MKITAIKNGIELKTAQKEAIKRAFSAAIKQALSEGKTINLEYNNAGNNQIHVSLYHTINGVDHKFNILQKFVGKCGGLIEVI